MPEPTRMPNGGGQADEHGHAHLEGLDLLAEELRRAPDHEARDEHREDGEAEHAVQAAAHATEDHLAERHLEDGG